MIKKEEYFSIKTLKAKAEEIRCSVESRRHLSDHIDFQSGHTAFLVLDMQDYFLQPGSHAYIPSAPAILPGINILVDSFANAGCPVFFTRHINTDADAGMMRIWSHELLRPEHPASHIIVQMNTSKGMVLEKSQYDAFYNTALDSMLRARAVEQVVIGGVMTHLCCETTARSAFMRGYSVFFLADGTATYNEAFHRASLLNLAHGFAKITLVDEIMAVLQANEN